MDLEFNRELLTKLDVMNAIFHLTLLEKIPNLV